MATPEKFVIGWLQLFGDCSYFFWRCDVFPRLNQFLYFVLHVSDADVADDLFGFIKDFCQCILHTRIKLIE